VKPLKKSSDVLLLGVSEGVGDVGDAGTDYNMVHIEGGSDDWLSRRVPVRIWLARWKSPSMADWTSPRKMRWAERESE
jgi:hypothetical protein